MGGGVGEASFAPSLVLPPPSAAQVAARSSFITGAEAGTPAAYVLPKASQGEGFLDLEEDLQSLDQ